MKPYMVFARNYEEFRSWCLTQKISPRSNGVIYATDLSLRGRKPEHYIPVFIGDWYMNPNYTNFEVIQQLGWIPYDGR